MAITQNLSNEWIAYATQEMDQNPGVFPAGHRFDPRRAPDYEDADAGIKQQRDLLLTKFMDQRTGRLRAEAETLIKTPPTEGIVEPSNGTPTLKPLEEPSNGHGLVSATEILSEADRRRTAVSATKIVGGSSLRQTEAIEQAGDEDFDGSLSSVHDHAKTHFERLPLSPLKR